MFTNFINNRKLSRVYAVLLLIQISWTQQYLAQGLIMCNKDISGGGGGGGGGSQWFSLYIGDVVTDHCVIHWCILIFNHPEFPGIMEYQKAVVYSNN